ncbi:hypothetical protein [Phaeodactylibacter xiamenensis]|uniref:hypothetical protein n=1 Tax=Phaeodactylibacter xiamenensis TaxID=1524460 RepID=UPI003CCBE544
MGDAGWCFSVRRSFSANIHPYGQVHTDKLWGVGNLNLSLNLSWGSAGLVLGEVEVGLWRGRCEVEVESQAMASWTDRRRSPAWERGLVFGAGSAGAVAWGKSGIFFSWMNLPSQRLRQAEETKITALHRSYTDD